MTDLAEDLKQRFYFDNFMDLMGRRIPAREGRPQR